MYRKNIAFIAMMVLFISLAARASSQKTLLDEMGLPMIPGAKVIMEANIPPGKLMDSITKEYGSWLGLSNLKEVAVVTLSVDPNAPSQKLLSYYDQVLNKPEWKTIAKSYDKNAAIAIVYSESNGMLVMNIDPPGKKDRQFTIVRILAKMDPSRLAGSQETLPDRIRQWIDGPFGPEGESGLPETVARILPGRPIAVPPARWLQVKTLRSDVKAYIKPQSIIVVDAHDKNDDYGEMVRTNTGLVLSTAPQLDISSLQLPSGVPIILQITEGSLTLAGPSNSNDIIPQFDLIATSAPVTLTDYPLTSGSHKIKVINAYANVSLSKAMGGSMEISITGGDLIFELPHDASASIEAAATSGKVQNLTGVQPKKADSNYADLVIGDGKSKVSLQAVNGNIAVKIAN